MKHSFSSLLAVLGWQMHIPLKGEQNEVLCPPCLLDLLPLPQHVPREGKEGRTYLWNGEVLPQ